MNVDNDTQFVYLMGIWDFVLKKQEYLKAQAGNPKGANKPNKKYDPRVWVWEGEKTLSECFKVARNDLGNDNRL